MFPGVILWNFYRKNWVSCTTDTLSNPISTSSQAFSYASAADIVEIEPELQSSLDMRAVAVWGALPGACEAMDGRTRAHMDVLVASPGKAPHTATARLSKIDLLIPGFTIDKNPETVRSIS